jgi:uncharacterized lipoprotein YddW (UPF0748 family)
MKKVRGIWLTNVASKVYDSENNIKEAIELISRTGFNVIFPVVWNKGYTLFRSDVMKQAFGKDFIIDSAYQASGRDPLAEIIAAAQTFKLKVIPWFEYGFAASAVQKTAAGGLQEFGKHILEKKPDFAAVDHSSDPLIKPAPKEIGDIGFKWMNSLNPDVQKFITEIVLEVVKNYDVDGIQGDDRLPAFPFEGFDQNAWNNFEAVHGAQPKNASNPKWMQFRAEILTQFLKDLCNQVRQVGTSKGKKLLISMAPHPRRYGFDNYLQDTQAWFDFVDVMHPQLYRGNFSKYSGLLSDEVSSLSDAQKAILSPGVLMRSGDKTIKTTYLSEAVKLNRKIGLAGEVFFFFEGLREPDLSTATTLRDPLYAVIKTNDEGPDVFKIQRLLKDLGKLDFDPGDIDGFFGNKTETAVRNFQSDNSLVVDGKVGSNTLKKLGIDSLAALGDLPIA